MPDYRNATLTDERWADHARKLRSIVIRMRGGNPGAMPDSALCLPGEAADCGEDHRAHIVGWYAQIQAMTVHNLTHIGEALGEGRVEELYAQAYESFVCAAAADPNECDHWRQMHGECPGPVY